MNLKTLKDIEFKPLNAVDVTKLKAEAVKWIKWREKNRDKYPRTMRYFIVEFFNLTEEDLK